MTWFINDESSESADLGCGSYVVYVKWFGLTFVGFGCSRTTFMASSWTSNWQIRSIKGLKKVPVKVIFSWRTIICFGICFTSWKTCRILPYLTRKWIDFGNIGILVRTAAIILASNTSPRNADIMESVKWTRNNIIVVKVASFLKNWLDFRNISISMRRAAMELSSKCFLSKCWHYRKCKMNSWLYLCWRPPWIN